MRLKFVAHYGPYKQGDEADIGRPLADNLVYSQFAVLVNDGLVPDTVSLPTKGKPSASQDKMIGKAHPRRRSKGQRKAGA